MAAPLCGFAIAWLACHAASPSPVAPIGPYDPDAAVIPETDDAAIVTSYPCVLITAQTADEVASSCVSHEEAVQMAIFLLVRRDGGKGDLVCDTIPFTELCASPAEMAIGIAFVDAQRNETMRARTPGKTYRK